MFLDRDRPDPRPVAIRRLNALKKFFRTPGEHLTDEIFHHQGQFAHAYTGAVDVIIDLTGRKCWSRPAP